MSNDKAFDIVIVGGGTAGWMTATLMAKKWQHLPVRITLVESPDVNIIGVGEGSTPTLKRFFEIIGVAESEWMAKCNATYKVNIRFANWSPASGIDSYCHPFPAQVDSFSSRAFLVNGRTRRLGLDVETQPEKFLLNGLLAEQGKGPLTPDNFPFKIEYGYHFDSSLLGQYLRSVAESLGVRYQQCHIDQVQQQPNGNISRLCTKQGETIDGDFFIDCTGFASLLMQKTLGVKFKSFKDNLFNDSAVVMPTPITEQIPSETLSTALSAGWCWKIPLTNRFGNGYVFSSDFINQDQAETEFRRHIGMLDSEQECHHLKMRVGQVEKHWHKNVLAIGLSQGFIEPLEATALHLVQIAIEMFIIDMEKGQFTNQLQDSYNQKVSERFERVRDYIVAHYKLNTRNDSDYWRANRDNNHISDSLLGVLKTWYNREDLAAEIERQNISTHFDSMSWNCLLAGYGAFPKLAPNQPGQGDLYHEKNIQSFVQGCALNFQSHQHNLKSISK
ncbi:tryptophan halogenase family protein [Thalassotalea sp. Y01]|uniref:tryptophan halogenase family protein n=1 Tax=Thalassotalea sp. Y01 TaxID=2729613 RepID=UPI00145D3FAA|nr:tryptophan halogenase family protein [Thalassotalea sp. Y01]NMP16293.1 tryptophan 7-halogenase [Thalassotalea sp. Y01]